MILNFSVADTNDIVVKFRISITIDVAMENEDLVTAAVLDTLGSYIGENGRLGVWQVVKIGQGILNINGKEIVCVEYVHLQLS